MRCVARDLSPRSSNGSEKPSLDESRSNCSGDSRFKMAERVGFWCRSRRAKHVAPNLEATRTAISSDAGNGGVSGTTFATGSSGAREEIGRICPSLLFRLIGHTIGLDPRQQRRAREVAVKGTILVRCESTRGSVSSRTSRETNTSSIKVRSTAKGSGICARATVSSSTSGRGRRAPEPRTSSARRRSRCAHGNSSARRARLMAPASG